MKSRKGDAPGSGILYFVFFLMIAMILAGIWGGMNIYFANSDDFRQDEANLLLRTISRCSENEGSLSLDNNTFLDKCGINGDVIEDGQHLIYINDSNGNELSIGLADYKIRCFLEARFEKRDLPLCAELNLNGNYILVASSQNPRRISL